MACINPDGTLTVVAQRVLSALTRPLTPAALAAAAGFPLYRVRGTLRETGQAGLVTETPEGFVLTDKGHEVLELAELEA
jgi:predicted transcriptional regulator